jgi:adenylate cyclase
MTVGDTPNPPEKAPAGEAPASAPSHGTPARIPGMPRISHPLLERLKEHHITRVALLYAGVCWVILEPVHVVFHMLGVPEWINRLVVIVMAMGFPIAIVAAWIYVTPAAGLKPDALHAHHSLLGEKNRRLNRAIASLAAIMVAYFLLYHFWLGKHITEPISDEARATHEEGSIAGAPVPLRSIAVLPFVDMSQAKDQQYLADGVAEELLNLLAKIPELRVAARTS